MYPPQRLFFNSCTSGRILGDHILPNSLNVIGSLFKKLIKLEGHSGRKFFCSISSYTILTDLKTNFTKFDLSTILRPCDAAD